MIIKKKKPLFGRFGDFAPGTVLGDYYDGDTHETYMKIEPVTIAKDGYADTICNVVNIETGDWGFFNDFEPVVPYINAKVVLE